MWGGGVVRFLDLLSGVQIYEQAVRPLIRVSEKLIFASQPGAALSQL